MSGSFVVTGGAGFIGCNVAQALNARGHDDLVIVDRVDCEDKRLNLAALKYRDYVDKDDFRALVRRGRLDVPEAVIHLGACSSTTETDEAFLEENNYRYTLDLCQWCLEHGVRFIYASSAATYGDGSLGYSDDDAITPRLQPLNAYGWSKQTFDLHALERGWFSRIVGLKYFNVYGPHEDHKEEMRSLVQKAYRLIGERGEMPLFRSHRPDYADGEQNRDFVYVRDAVKVTLFFLDHQDVSGLFNCGTGEARTWLDLARGLFQAMDLDPRIRFVDMPESIRDKYQYHTQADVSKLRAAGYKGHFTPLEDGIRDYVQSYLVRRFG